MEDGIFGDRFRRRKSGGRRSSILKTKTPLLDLDPNQPIAESVVPRKKARISEARRVSFAETYQVKEFFRDSPQWIPDPEAEDDSSPELENLPDVPLHSSRSEIQGLDKLLTCPIQNNSSAEQNDLEEIPQLEENAPVTQNGSNHTILQEDTMDITDCLDQSNMIENLTKPLVEDFGTTFGDGKAFTTNLQKSSTESFSDKLFLPEKNFSRDDYKNHYNLDKESDFKTIVNTSINKYSIINASQTTVAGVAQTSMTTSITQRKPLTSINESMVFKPVVVERCNIVDIQDNLTGTVDGLSFLKQLNSTKSSSVFLEDHTVMFDGYDMEETEVLTKNIQYNDEKGSFILETDKIHSSLVSSQSFKSNNLAGTVDGSPFLKQLKSTKSKSVFKEDHTVMFDCYDMEETEVLTRNIQYNEEKGALVPETDKIHSGQVSSQSSKRDNNKTVFFGNDNDIEETKVITSDVDIYSNVETNGKEESKVLTSGVEFGASINAMNYKTIFFKSDDLEQTKAFTGKLELGTSIPENKTMLYKDDEMEQTKALTGKLELGTSVPEKSILYKNDEMEQTKAFTGKLDLGTSVPENKTVLYKDEEMEQTKALTGKLELGTSVPEKSILYENDEMEQTKAFTGKLYLGTSVPEKSILYKNDEMEQTKAFTGKLDLGTSVPENKTVLYKDEEMEQTKALTGKLELGTSVPEKSILYKNDEMEQTKAFTGKLDLCTSVPEKSILYKNDEMEQTKVFTGKLDLGTSVVEKSVLYKNDEMEQTKVFTGKLDLGTSVVEKSILYKNDEMEQTKAFTGKLELGTSVPEKSILYKNDEMEQTKVFTGKLDLGTSVVEKSILYKNDEMEQTKAFTGKLELGTSVPQNKTVLYKDEEMEQTKALTGKLEIGTSVPENKTVLYKNEEMEQTKALTGKLDLGTCVPENKTVLYKDDEMEQTKALTGKLELGTSVPEKSILYKNDEMEQMKAFTGKLYLGTSVPEKSILYKNDEMEQTKVFTGKLDLGTSVVEKSILYKNDEMEQTKAFTGKLELGTSVPQNKTVLYKDEEMEQTKALTGKLEIGTSVPENKTVLYKNEEMEQTKALTGKLDLGTSVPENKTVLYKNEEMEQTKALTGKLDLGTSVPENKTMLYKDDEMEQTKALTGKLELGTSVPEKSILYKNDEMEQTKAFTGKLYLGTSVPEKSILYKNDEMEQTKAFTGKLDLGTSVPENKTVLYKDVEMEQTKALTGKLELGTSIPEKSILFKNDEMEQTKAFTGKLDLGTTITEKSILFKNNEMEQTKAFTGKLDLGTSIPEKSILLQNDKMEQKKAVTGKLELGTSIPKNKTVLYKDDEMEQTKALTRKLDFWGKDMELTSAKHGTENEFIKNKYKRNCALIQMIQKRHQDEIDIANDTTGVEDQNSSKAVANEIDNKKSVNNLELRRGGMSGIIAKLRQDMGTDDCEFTENLEITENNFDISATGNLTDKNNVCKKEYLEDLKSLEILNDKKTSNLKRQDVGTSGCEFTENFDSKRLKLGNAQELRGVSSIIAKFRRDMGTDDYEFTEDHFDITETGKIIDVNIKSKITYSDDLNNLEILDDNKTSNIKVDKQYLTGMMERMEKNPSRSFGLQTRTPMGKLFGNTREAFSERQPLTRGSTVKLTDRAALTECKTAQDHKQHQALTCSKALFSNHECPMNDEGGIRISPLPQLESCMNVTVGDRSCCQRSGKSNESFPVLELGGNDIVTGISDEQLPAELLSNSTMRSGHLDSTASSHCADINLTSCSVAQSIIESQMDHDLMKQIEDGEGPLSVQTFCRKMQMALPSWLKEGKLLNPRHSIATLTKVEKDTVRGKLEAKYIHEPYYDVYSAVNEQAQMRITNCKERIEEFNEHIKEQQPAIFDIAVNGSQELKDETREKLRVLAKCCTKEVKRQWKIMKLECHEQFYKRIVESRDVLSDEVDELVQASETVQQQITSLSNVTSNIDEMISELEQKPLPSQEDVKFLKTSQQEILQKTQALESINTTQKELEREKEELEKEKSNLEKEEMALKEEEATNEQSTLKMEIKELKEKLDTLESLIEWCIDDWQDNFINFLFYDGSMQLTINKQQEPDNGRTKITSAHVQSLLDGDAKPSVKLIHSIILKRINEVSLLQSYSYTSELPQILHALSRIVLDARNLKTQINSISIKYLVSVYEDFIKVEKWSLKTLRKVDIKFTFSLEDLSVHILPDVTVTMGCIRPEDVLEQLNSISKGQDYLIRLCDTVNLDILSSVQKIS